MALCSAGSSSEKKLAGLKAGMTPATARSHAAKPRASASAVFSSCTSQPTTTAWPNASMTTRDVR